jgi:hypothetical protein
VCSSGAGATSPCPLIAAATPALLSTRRLLAAVPAYQIIGWSSNITNTMEIKRTGQGTQTGKLTVVELRHNKYFKSGFNSQ